MKLDPSAKNYDGNYTRNTKSLGSRVCKVKIINGSLVKTECDSWEKDECFVKDN